MKDSIKHFDRMETDLLSREFEALEANEAENGFYLNRVSRRISELADYPIVIKVDYSSINYKDALSAQGNRGVTRTYPHTPGIDAVGTVAWISPLSERKDLSPGDEVLVTGFDLGMNTDGGWGEYISVKDDWPILLPHGLTTVESMTYGTAGVTAAMAIDRIERTLNSLKGKKVAVTGANGGVSTVAILMLDKLGSEVIAYSRSNKGKERIESLGAQEVRVYPDFTPKPLLTPEWDAVMDSCGGKILEYFLKSTKFGGVVTSFGVAAGADVNTTVYPFILRGIELQGIASADSSREYKNYIWNRIASDLRITIPEDSVKELSLEEVPEVVELFTGAGAKGRYIVRHRQ